MANPEALRRFAIVHDIPTLTVRDLIVYRRLIDTSETERRK